jgi:hypothetical protein
MEWNDCVERARVAVVSGWGFRRLPVHPVAEDGPWDGAGMRFHWSSCARSGGESWQECPGSFESEAQRKSPNGRSSPGQSLFHLYLN